MCIGHLNNVPENLIPITLGQLNTSLGKFKPVRIKVLFNSGGTGTIMCSLLSRKLHIKKNKTKINWNTIAGEITMTGTSKVQFSLPDFFEGQVIECNVHLTEMLQNYDMIVGRDLLSELGIDINFSNQTCSWNNVSIPMKESLSSIN